MTGSCYVSAMVRKVNRSRRRPHSITPLDGEHITTLPDIVLYMDGMGTARQNRPAWRRVAELLLEKGLNVTGRSRRYAARRAPGAAKATELAAKEPDRLGDASATEEERQSRKRRTLKGPREVTKYARTSRSLSAQRARSRSRSSTRAMMCKPPSGVRLGALLHVSKALSARRRLDQAPVLGGSDRRCPAARARAMLPAS
jgi:hypothetical protein